jgi:hypothetical protein
MRTIANTPTNIYFDSASVKKYCDKDFKAIARACKPESNNSNSRKKKGLAGTLSKMTDKLDNLGQKASGYVRNRGNAWMDDHCSGLWIKPNIKGYDPEQLQALKDAIDKLDAGILDKFGMLKDSLDDMFELAKEILPGDLVEEMAQEFALKTGVKVGIGALGVETVVITAAMWAWAAYDVVDTATKLAELMGDKGKQALNAILGIKDIDERVKEFANDLVTQPAKAHANLMSLLALMDSCLRARKCLLVPYSEQNANSGDGCCPGQTGHHIIPDAAASAGSCAPYNKNAAPVMCLEGTSNNKGWGTHGNAHARLKVLMKKYREDQTLAGKSPNTISYEDMASNGVDAVRSSGAALQCDKNCLLAQLKAYYNCPNGMPPNDGTGPMSHMPEPTKPSDDNKR